VTAKKAVGRNVHLVALILAHADRFMDILARFASVAERWADVEYPVRDASEAEIYKAGSPDEPNSREAYEALPEADNRFVRKFTDTHPEG
jgi:hypothetical protein